MSEYISLTDNGGAGLAEMSAAIAETFTAAGPKLTPGRLKVIDNYLRRALENAVHAQELISDMLVGKDSTDSPYLISLRNTGIKLDPAGAVIIGVKDDLIDLSAEISSAL